MEEATVELLIQLDQRRLVNIGMYRLRISLYYHPASTQRLEAITIVVILDQEVLKVHGVLLLILTLDGNIVMCPSVVSTRQLRSYYAEIFSLVSFVQCVYMLDADLIALIFVF